MPTYQLAQLAIVVLCAAVGGFFVGYVFGLLRGCIKRLYVDQVSTRWGAE